VIGAALSLVLGIHALAVDGSPTCPAAAVTAGSGIVDPFHVPAAAATKLNADALSSYRQGRWDDARSKYRAAEAADPEFLAPALNIACSFVRQERFPEAMAEVRRLLDRAFLPWSDEIASAADLGALKVPPEGQGLRGLLDEDRRRWAEGLDHDLLFVARTRAPLKLGNAERAAAGTFVLGPRQEIFAWSPRTRRYRQLTVEQGRVLLLGRSRDGRRIAYATAEKLVFAPSTVPTLRGVVLKEVDLGTLAVLAQARAPDDLGRLEILQSGAGFAYRVAPLAGKGTTFVIRGGQLERSAVARNAKVAGTLTGKGAGAVASRLPLDSGCPGDAREARTADGTPAVEIHPRPGKSFVVSGPFGGGLAGLPIP
jgi:hypothetical protein